MIHIPLYCTPDVTPGTRLYMIELLLGCLDSYFSHGNDHPLLVTTNDPRPLEVLSAYRAVSGHRFDLRFVERRELCDAFSIDEQKLEDGPCTRMIYSKFFPMRRRLDESLVHVDLDTLFLGKIDWSLLHGPEVALIDANRFQGRLPWGPRPDEMSFFRLKPSATRPVANWVNTGVFAVQRGGFELCGEAVDHFLAHLDQATSLGLNRFPDELLLNALALRERERVRVLPHYQHNFLAYYLRHDPAWLDSPSIVHFHATKPTVYFQQGGAVRHHCRPEQERHIDENFYLASLIWFSHLHSAARGLPFRSKALAGMPIEIVERERAALLAKRRAATEAHPRASARPRARARARW